MIALLIAIPLAFAFASIPHERLGRYFLPFVALFNLVCLFFFMQPEQILEIGKWPAAYGIVLVLDSVSYPFLIFVNLLILLMSLSATLENRYGTLMLVLTAAVNGIILTGDFFNSFVFLEIISVIAYIVAAHKDNALGAFKYLIFGGIGGTMYLIGAVSVYIKAGTLNMAYASFITDPLAVPIICIFFLITFLVELKVLPLGLWAPDVYSNGSSFTPVALGSIVTVSLVYLFSRIFLNIFDLPSPELVGILAMVSIIFAELGALKQKNLGRALSFATISGISTVVAALSIQETEVVSAAYFYLFNDVISKFILFTLSAYLGKRGFKSNKTAGIAFTFASLSVIGFPMFAGFWAKYYLLKALFQVDSYALPAVILIAAVIEAGYLIRWNIDLWYKYEEESVLEHGKDTENEEGIESIEEIDDFVPFGAQVVTLILALTLVVIGFMPNLIHDQTMNIANNVLDFRPYFDLILRGGM
ncbi:MAG TPA: proton-conducting transporter membrane subunit [Fervidobacterium sp.]|nr:proton-conducting transporter membrane subunit [Fervidobacterium sp.]HPT53600.1 proton-conducting transporter membrane subunit [Fervidobacterium sp.]HPZ18311.1 proton-conducting transporter membrane subunit [Fervidobacterium sp.]HQE49422.1 proton-conducting transporter membrane subunit [Fervidobacterium sp.]HUM43219.1 proton-conducting transporter membrane subunit [Fervidobacterium sp.]